MSMAVSVDFESILADPGDGDVYEDFLAFSKLALSLVRDALVQAMDTMEGAQQQRTEKLIESIDKQLKAIEKEKTSGILKVFADILGALAMIFTIAATILAPTPAMFLVLAMTMFMYLEPLIANANGDSSIVAQGMNAIMQPLIEKLGPVLGPVVGVLLIVAACILVTKSLGGAKSAINASSNATAVRCREVVNELIKYVRTSCGNMTPAQQAALLKYLEVIASCLQMGQGVMMGAMEKVIYDGAVLMEEFGDLQAESDLWTSAMGVISDDIEGWQRLLSILNRSPNKYFS